MKFGDKDIYGSNDGVNTKLRRLISVLNDEVSKMALTGKDDYVLIALRGLTNYAGVLFECLISYQKLPIEYNAITARNLLECSLLIAYIISDPSKAKEFLSQKATEELEINEGFLSLKTANTSVETIRLIKDRMAHIKEIIRMHGLTSSRHWTVSYLAQQTNNQLEYEAFFKLYSKYVHPSSWLVNSSDNEVDNPIFRNIFFLQGQLYASCIVKLITEYQDGRTNA